jgi:serine/threonine-protein kinase
MKMTRLRRWHGRHVRQLDAKSPSRRYVLGRQIGAGGFGEVYAATDRFTGQQLAIKFYRSRARDVVAAAFKARVVHHPNVVPVLEAGDLEGTSYLVMPLIAGRTLADRLADRAFTPRETIELLEGIASALDELHGAGVVHRDIKPSNIMVTDEPVTRAVLLDFGPIPTVDADAAGRFVGTPAYAAPEQISKEAADASADIYGLAAVLAECVTAMPLFSRPTYAETVRAHLEREKPLIELDNPVARALAPVLEKGLALDPKRRYTRASDLIDAARTVLHELPPELLDQPLAQGRPQEPTPTTVRP